MKVDRATMSVGLEGREPLLDYRLVEYMLNKGEELKIDNDLGSKWVLKEICYKYLPKTLMDRPKKGFAVPLERWLKEDLRPYVEYYLSDERISRGGFFDVLYVSALRDGFYAGKDVDKNKIWYLLIFEMWKEKWLDE